eukprot:SAG31_NODE_4612_length_3097_cov_2.555704_3_plen_100_part_00
MCFMPPMIETLTALQSERTSQDTTMLKYWILFAFMQLFESSGISGWIPYFYYYTFKTVLLLWAWHMKGVEVSGNLIQYMSQSEPWIITRCQTSPESSTL